MGCLVMLIIAIFIGNTYGAGWGWIAFFAVWLVQVLIAKAQNKLNVWFDE